MKKEIVKNNSYCSKRSNNVIDSGIKCSICYTSISNIIYKLKQSILDENKDKDTEYSICEKCFDKDKYPIIYTKICFDKIDLCSNKNINSNFETEEDSFYTFKGGDSQENKEDDEDEMDLLVTELKKRLGKNEFQRKKSILEEQLKETKSNEMSLNNLSEKIWSSIEIKQSFIEIITKANSLEKEVLDQSL